MNKILVSILLVVFLFSFSQYSYSVEEGLIDGKWRGEIDISGQKLGIIVNFNNSEDGYTGTLDIPAQGAMGIPLGKISIDKKEIKFDVPALPGNAKFAGNIEGKVIKGDFHQSGYTFSFEIEKVNEKTESKENTTINYATGEYKIEEREVKILVDGGELAGVITLPKNVNKPLPAVILVAGSGPTDRDGNNPLLGVEINTLKEIAHYLSSRGIITVRYDKRGIKESSHLIEGETPSFLAYRDDLIKTISYVSALDEVNKKEVYVAGHSEGAMLSIMAADNKESLAGIVLISGSGSTHGETLRKQLTAIAEQYESAGQEEVKEEMLKALDDLYQVIRKGGNFNINNYNIPEKMKTTYLSLANQQDFARDWLDVDPVEILNDIDFPVCIIQGTTDNRVSEEDAKKLASAVSDRRLQLHILEGVNHYLKKAVAGNPAPNQRIDEEVMKAIFNFVK